MNREQSEKLLAAYLLDELDAAAHAAMDAAIAADADLRDRLADMRMALKLVSQGLEEEGQPRLSEARRATLLAAVAKPTSQPNTRRMLPWSGRRLLSALAAVAATILLVAGITAFVMLPGHKVADRTSGAVQAVGEGKGMLRAIAAPQSVALETHTDERRYALLDRKDDSAGWDYKPGLTAAADMEKGEKQNGPFKSRYSLLTEDKAKSSIKDGIDSDRANGSVPPTEGCRNNRSSIREESQAGKVSGYLVTIADRNSSGGLWGKTGSKEMHTKEMHTTVGGSGSQVTPPAGSPAQPTDESSRKQALGPDVKDKYIRQAEIPFRTDEPNAKASADRMREASMPPTAAPVVAKKAEAGKETLGLDAKMSDVLARRAATVNLMRARTLDRDTASHLAVAMGEESTRSGDQKTITPGKSITGMSKAELSWQDELQYPKNWRELTLKREPHGLSSEAAAGESAPTKADDAKQIGQSLGISCKPVPAEPNKLSLDDKATNQDVGGIVGNHSSEGEAVLRRDGGVQFHKPTTSASTLPAGDIYSGTRANDDDGKDEGAKHGLPPASTFREVPVNPWVMTDRDRFSTFASDVDTASYNLCRSYLRSGCLPPRGAVRMEEFVNAFDYNYPRQARGVFNVFAEGMPSPFAQSGENTVLLKIGVQGRVIGREGRKSAHLVFVVDTSGSMAKPDRLPLIQDAIKMLADALGPNDRITLITYNRRASLVLECVAASRKAEIVAACDSLRAGGPTNLLEGLKAGYELARREFAAGRINRVILCTDGAANIGQTDSQAILDSVAAYRRQGITLTVAGFGQGGYNDELLETLAKNGDGSYIFIDTLRQARESLVEKMNAAIQTIAFDSRIQVEFNPDRIRRYRLIGYEKRQIADEDFRNDTIDAAEVGSGQSATALYEVELKESGAHTPLDVLGTVYVRYRNADNRQVEEISHRIEARMVRPMSAEENPRFYLAACAAQFAEILRESPNVKNGNFRQVERVLQHVCQALPLDDKAGELLQLVGRAKDLPRAP